MNALPCSTPSPREELAQADGPPQFPRPSHFEIMAAYERICISENWDVTAKMNQYIEEGRVAAEGAKGREQALSVLGFAPAEPTTAAPTDAQ